MKVGKPGTVNVYSDELIAGILYCSRNADLIRASGGRRAVRRRLHRTAVRIAVMLDPDRVHRGLCTPGRTIPARSGA